MTLLTKMLLYNKFHSKLLIKIMKKVFIIKQLTFNIVDKNVVIELTFNLIEKNDDCQIVIIEQLTFDFINKMGTC